MHKISVREWSRDGEKRQREKMARKTQEKKKKTFSPGVLALSSANLDSLQ